MLAINVEFGGRMSIQPNFHFAQGAGDLVFPFYGCTNADREFGLSITSNAQNRGNING